MPGEVLKVSKRYSRPNLSYWRKTTRGGGAKAPPPSGRGLRLRSYVRSRSGQGSTTYPIHLICEQSVRSGIFPTVWKQANVIPVHKKGSKKCPDNYRPVSLLPICSKILEIVVCDSLLPACLPVLPASQHGFIPKRSCITNLSCFLEHCWTSINLGKQTDAVYTDFSSAFTSVNHVLLLHKLRYSFGITGCAYDWLESYLSNRTQRVVINPRPAGPLDFPPPAGEGGVWTPLPMISAPGRRREKRKAAFESSRKIISKSFRSFFWLRSKLRSPGVKIPKFSKMVFRQ